MLYVNNSYISIGEPNMSNLTDVQKCFKCGVSEGEMQRKYRTKYMPAIIILHHLSYTPEIIVPCCQSCHVKIHKKIRKTNACTLSVKDAHYLSHKSSCIRDQKKNRQSISFDETIMPNVFISERLHYRKTTGSVIWESYFKANNGRKLYVVEVN